MAVGFFDSAILSRGKGTPLCFPVFILWALNFVTSYLVFRKMQPFQNIYL